MIAAECWVYAAALRNKKCCGWMGGRKSLLTYEGLSRHSGFVNQS